MNGPDLALECTPSEPDAVLLEQLTALASASMAIPGRPWWRRLATKSSAAALVGVLAASGTAYAGRAQIVPIVQSVVTSPDHGAVHDQPAGPPAAVIPVRPVSDQSAEPQAKRPQASAPHGKATRAHGHHPKRGKGLGWTK